MFDKLYIFDFYYIGGNAMTLDEILINYENGKIEHPSVGKTMWNLIVKKKMPPTRLIRYCCKELKEKGGNNRIKIVGVRAEESFKRRERESRFFFAFRKSYKFNL